MLIIYNVILSLFYLIVFHACISNKLCYRNQVNGEQDARSVRVVTYERDSNGSIIIQEFGTSGINTCSELPANMSEIFEEHYLINFECDCIAGVNLTYTEIWYESNYDV